MDDYLRDMLGGPGSMRFFIQPLVAVLLGVRDGIRDHRMGEPPYLLELIRGRKPIKGALVKILIPLTLAVVASCLFQYLIRTRIQLLYALIYALVFVAVPYLICRALANRFATRASSGAGPSQVKR